MPNHVNFLVFLCFVYLIELNGRGSFFLTMIKLSNLLRVSADLFVWTHEDMPVIVHFVKVHLLNQNIMGLS